MNPTVPAAEIEREYEKDAASVRLEFGAEFRSDIESFINVDAVRACMSVERERLPDRQYRYYGFCDPSGGSNDVVDVGRSTQSWRHRCAGRDQRNKAAIQPRTGCGRVCEAITQLWTTLVYGDRYAGEWCREVFRRHRINYEPSDRPKSDLYRDLLPLINSGGVDLLDHDKMLHQLVSLERRTARGGKDSD